jgi:hypothetical protein
MLRKLNRRITKNEKVTYDQTQANTNKIRYMVYAKRIANNVVRGMCISAIRSSKYMCTESMPRFFHEPLQAMLGRVREH